MLEEKETKWKLQLVFPEMSFEIEASESDSLLMEQTWPAALKSPRRKLSAEGNICKIWTSSSWLHNKTSNQ